MKKLVVLLTITFCAIGANAQFYLGIKSGGGLGGLSTTGTYVHSYGINIYNGLAYKQQVSERIMLEGDLLFDIRSTVVDPGVGGTFLLNASYISVPLTAHWMTPFRKKEMMPYRVGQPNSFWYVEGGPAVMYALSASNTYQDPIAAGNEDFDPETDLTPRKLDVAFVAGLGVNFGFKNNLNRLSIGGRSSFGFLNYNKYPGATVLKNIAFGGFLQYDFSLKQKRYYQYRW
ncbi:PorT family protein [bacterium]|nr:PorT family protein [bacterium]